MDIFTSVLLTLLFISVCIGAYNYISYGREKEYDFLSQEEADALLKSMAALLKSMDEADKNGRS